MILLAVGYFALVVSTGDLRIAARLAGERKAMSAAESGVHVLCVSFDPVTFAGLTGQTIDPADPASTFDVSIPAPPTNTSIPYNLPLPGFSISGGQEWSQKLYETVVTGHNSEYGSKVEIGLGVGYFDGGGIMYR